MRFKKIKLAIPFSIGWGMWLLVAIVLFTKYPENVPLEQIFWIDQIKFWIGVAFPIAGTMITVALDWKWSEKK